MGAWFWARGYIGEANYTNQPLYEKHDPVIFPIIIARHAQEMCVEMGSVCRDGERVSRWGSVCRDGGACVEMGERVSIHNFLTCAGKQMIIHTPQR